MMVWLCGQHNVVSVCDSFSVRRVRSLPRCSVSICFFRDEWRPDSFYDKIKANVQNQFHTLCLLGQNIATSRSLFRRRCDKAPVIF
jgi:hypothetical protein